MLEPACGLSDRAVRALTDLEQRTVAHDGGRLKLEWGVLRARRGQDVEDLLWWDGERLAGFLGIYAFGPPSVELAGMVDPSDRRRGIGTALLDAALPLCRERGFRDALLVTPRNTAGGREFARHRGAELDHSEYALVQREPPPEGAVDPDVALRIATRADADVTAASLAAAFGSAPPDVAEQLEKDEHGTTYVIERAGTPIGTVRVTRDDDVGSVYGFGVDPEWRGRGIGRDVLRRICRRFWADGVSAVALEVAIENENALGLYTSLGFRPVNTEDYYKLPL